MNSLRPVKWSISKKSLSERCDFVCRVFLSSLWRILSRSGRNNGRAWCWCGSCDTQSLGHSLLTPDCWESLTLKNGFLLAKERDIYQGQGTLDISVSSKTTVSLRKSLAPWRASKHSIRRQQHWKELKSHTWSPKVSSPRRGDPHSNFSQIGRHNCVWS